MTVLYLILLVLAAACFAVSAFGQKQTAPKINVLPLGLFLWVLVPLLSTLQALLEKQ